MGVYGIGLASFVNNVLVYMIQHYYLLTLEKAKETTAVPFFDRNNLIGIGGYVSLAIPSLFSIMFQCMGYDILSIMASTYDK